MTRKSLPILARLLQGCGLCAPKEISEQISWVTYPSQALYWEKPSPTLSLRGTLVPFSFLLGLGHSDLYFPKCSSPQLARTLIFQDLSICQFENNGVFFPPLELCLRAYFSCVLKATLTRNSGLGKSPNYLFIFPIRIICLISLLFLSQPHPLLPFSLCLLPLPFLHTPTPFLVNRRQWFSLTVWIFSRNSYINFN